MDIKRTDPEFTERFEHFALDKVVNEEGQRFPASTRYLAILAILISCGSVDAYGELLPKTLENGVTSDMAKEYVYQATDYLGYGRVLPFLNAVNTVLEQKEIALPRTGLDLKQREMITFCFLMVQSGCELSSLPMPRAI